MSMGRTCPNVHGAPHELRTERNGIRLSFSNGTAAIVSVVLLPFHINYLSFWFF
jgi:hypothetical protein